MARADLLLKLVKSGTSGDTLLFKRVVRSIIAEEKTKQHHVLAEQLEGIIANGHGKNGTKGVYLNGKGNEIEKFLYQYTPQIKLSSLYFPEKIHLCINELKEEHFRKDLLRSYNLEPRHRVLFTGDPGTGKTSLAEAIATELMIPFHVVRYDGIIGSYLGETATRLSKMFDYISTQECVLFFDEFDAIGKERGDVHETGEIKRVVNSLLLQIDKLPSYVIVVAATNHPELLDRAVWRRFQLRIDLVKPDKYLIEKFIVDYEKGFDLKLGYKPSTIANKLYGLSFSEITDFFNNIRRKYVLSLPNSKLKNIVKSQLDNLSVM